MLMCVCVCVCVCVWMHAIIEMLHEGSSSQYIFHVLSQPYSNTITEKRIAKPDPHFKLVIPSSSWYHQVRGTIKFVVPCVWPNSCSETKKSCGLNIKTFLIVSGFVWANTTAPDSISREWHLATMFSARKLEWWPVNWDAAQHCCCAFQSFPAVSNPRLKNDEETKKGVQ